MQLTNIVALALLGTVASAWNLSLRYKDQRSTYSSDESGRSGCRLLEPVAPDMIAFESLESFAQVVLYSTGNCERGTVVHTQCYGSHQQSYKSPGTLARSFKIR